MVPDGHVGQPPNQVSPADKPENRPCASVTHGGRVVNSPARLVYSRARAGVAELVDAPDSKSGGGDTVSVRFRPSVPKQHGAASGQPHYRSCSGHKDSGRPVLQPVFDQYSNPKPARAYVVVNQALTVAVVVLHESLDALTVRDGPAELVAASVIPGLQIVAQH